MSAPHFVVHNDTDTVGVVVVEDVKTGIDLTGWKMESDETITVKARTTYRSATRSRLPISRMVTRF